MVERALTVRQNGDVQLPADTTKAIWAASGTGTNAEVNRALAIVGDHYALDPALGEVMLLGGKLYITFEGYLRIAEQNPAYEGYEMRPMTEQERKDAKVAPEEYAYICHVHRKDRRFPSIGYGVASDSTVSMSTIKPYKRELAEARAFRRALKMAFRAGIPDYEEYVESVDQGQPIVVEALPSPPELEKPPMISPDWPRFWVHIKGLGVSKEEVHQALEVESVKDWQRSLEEAIAEVEKWVYLRDWKQSPPEPTAPVAQQTATPAPTPAAKARRPLTRDELVAAYRGRCDTADALGVPATTYDPKWTDQQLKDEGLALKEKIQAAEANIPQQAVG